MPIDANEIEVGMLITALSGPMVRSGGLYFSDRSPTVEEDRSGQGTAMVVVGVHLPYIACRWSYYSSGDGQYKLSEGRSFDTRLYAFDRIPDEYAQAISGSGWPVLEAKRAELIEKNKPAE